MHTPARKSRRTDVLIVGSGAVGVAAGLEVHEAGAQVIILEKEAYLGGAAAISGGGCSCVGTLLHGSMASQTRQTWPSMTGLRGVRVPRMRSGRAAISNTRMRTSTSGGSTWRAVGRPHAAGRQ